MFNLQIKPGVTKLALSDVSKANFDKPRFVAPINTIKEVLLIHKLEATFKP